MVVDSSAVLAILLKEADAKNIAEAMVADGTRLISVVSVLECSAVIESRHGPSGSRELDLLLHRTRLETVALETEQLEHAREAYRRFGKGRHPAALNLADCCTYALARQSGEPLLFKGDDFRRTDLAAVDY